MQAQRASGQGLPRKAVERAIEGVNAALGTKIDASKIVAKLFGKESRRGLLELVEGVRDFISDTREKLELHFFVLAKVLDRTKKNTLQVLEKHGLLSLSGPNALDCLERESEARFEPVPEGQFVKRGRALLGLSEKNARRMFHFLADGGPTVDAKALAALVDQFRASYHFRKFFEAERISDVRAKAERVVKALGGLETEAFLDHFRRENVSLADFGDFEGLLDRNGKVCLLDLRATLVEDMERHGLSPDAQVIGRFLKALDLDANGSIEAKEFVVLLHAEKLAKCLDSRPGLAERKKADLQTRLEQFLNRKPGRQARGFFRSELALFDSLFQTKAEKWASTAAEEASFVREYNRKFESNLRGEDQEKEGPEGRATDRTGDTVNEIRQLIDDEIFDGKRPAQSRRDPQGGDNERILDECNAVLKKHGLGFQDVLDELDFDAELNISVIKVRQFFKYRFADSRDFRTMVKSLRFVDKNRNGSTDYMEVLEFFTGTSSALEVHPLKTVFLSNNLSGNFGARLGSLIKSKNCSVARREHLEALGQRSNQAAQRRIQEMSGDARLKLFAEILAKHELSFEEVIDEMDFDRHLNVCLVEVKAFLKERLGDATDAREALCVLRELDSNGNGLVNYSEFLAFLQRLRGVSGADCELATETESPLESSLSPGSLHHRFKFDKTYQQSRFKAHADSREAKTRPSASLMRAASSRHARFEESVRAAVPQLSRSDSAVVDQNAQVALHKLHRLNAQELAALKDSSDSVFACAPEIGFLGLKSLFDQAKAGLTAAEELAVFKIIDDNHSHRICQSEFEAFVARLLSEIQCEAAAHSSGLSGGNAHEQKLMSTLQAELSKALFADGGLGTSTVKSAARPGGSNVVLAGLKAKLGEFAKTQLLEMSAVNQSSLDVYAELAKLEKSCYKNFRLVFNCPFAALKACLDATRELERTKAPLFSDPEFGPSAGDKFGASSIYFKETLPGYPQPEDMTWLRPAEIAGDGGID